MCVCVYEMGMLSDVRAEPGEKRAKKLGAVREFTQNIEIRCFRSHFLGQAIMEVREQQRTKHGREANGNGNEIKYLVLVFTA